MKTKVPKTCARYAELEAEVERLEAEVEKLEKEAAMQPGLF